MGLFDSVYLSVPCPACGETRERELQTKDLDCQLRVFRVGDMVFPPTAGEPSLRCVVECVPCAKGAPPLPLHTFFFLRVLLDAEGCVTGETAPLTEEEYSHHG